MNLFEFGRRPVAFSVRQARWLGGIVQRSISNETGLDNIVSTWREPIWHEVAHHADDARHTHDIVRFIELHDVQRGMELFAPNNAKEYAELARTEHLPPNPQDIDLLLYRFRHEGHGEA